MTPASPHKTPRSPLEMVAGLYFLGRTIDKIRLRETQELRPDFFELMGQGFDGRLMSFLGLDYQKFADFVRSGATDQDCAAYVIRESGRLNESNLTVWNDFASKRGREDSGSERLAKFKAESGLAGRTDIETFFQYWDVDEGRSP